jgi:solute carrier family 25 protein 39/40
MEETTSKAQVVSEPQSSFHKTTSATFGALFTSILMTPFDVVKTRIQVIESGTVEGTKFKGTFNGMIYIARKESIFNLWRGLIPALACSLPSTVMYYTGYEKLRDIIAENFTQNYAPVYAGAISRMIAVTAVSPVELLRTRIQAATTDSRKIGLDLKLMVQV